MSNMRFLANLELEDENGIKHKINFGKWFVATKIVDTDDGFYDIYLDKVHNSRIFYGVSADVVELHHIKPEKVKIIPDNTVSKKTK